jgi:hypothetical protein
VTTTLKISAYAYKGKVITINGGWLLAVRFGNRE